jgi:uncharacterized protein YoxC
MDFSIPDLIEAISVLTLVVFIAVVLMKLAKLIDKYSEKIEDEKS